MEETRVREMIAEAAKIMDAALFRLIQESLVLDGEYCKQLDACLSNEKKLVDMTPAEKEEWLNYAFHNICRCYLIKTFTYNWLHKLYLKGENAYLDAYWKERLDHYFGEQI